MEFAINNIGELIRYFAPGLVFLYIFHYITNKDDKLQLDGNNFVVIVLISYVTINIFKAILTIFSKKIYSIESDALSLMDLCLIVMIVVIAIVCGLIRNNQKFEKNVVEQFLHRTYNGSVWDSMKDLKYGCTVTLFKKNGEYIYGFLSKYFEEKNEMFFVLSQYIKYDKNGNKKEDRENLKTHYLVVPLSELSEVEYVYDVQSDKIEELETLSPRDQKKIRKK